VVVRARIWARAAGHGARASRYRRKSLGPRPNADVERPTPAFAVMPARRGTIEFNGKQASVFWAGIRGSRRAWRTCAFCESARADPVSIGAFPAVAFAQTRADRELSDSPQAGPTI
jgi:hypothetical protein